MHMFEKIKKEYQEFYRELSLEGKFTLKDTEKGYWGTAVADEVYEIFKKIDLCKYKNFLDLGSGDGRIVMIASLFTRSAGVEFDRELHEKAVEISGKLGVDAELINQDYHKLDLSGYDVIFFFPDKSLPYRLDRKLAKELKGRLVVYGPHFFRTNFLKKVKKFDIGGTIVNIFTR